MSERSSSSIKAIFEAKSTHPVADNRGDSFARTPHFHPECERAINEQINIEYNVSYIYHAMYAYFARDNVYLPGIAKHFLKESLEERSHAELLMNYQIMCGVRAKESPRLSATGCVDLASTMALIDDDDRSDIRRDV